MWTAQHWQDYEVLDTSCGEKLERWGEYLLVPKAAANGNFFICPTNGIFIIKN